MSLLEYFFLTLSSLFVIIDPIAAAPAFVAMTVNNSVQERIRMARLACLVATAVLLTFALTGTWIFKLLGISLPAFQVAGSVVLFLVALDMLRARRSRVQETTEETDAGVEKDDIAITPLAVPMLAGPGAITTAVLLQKEAQGLMQSACLYLSIVIVCTASYWLLRLSAHGSRWLSPIALRLTTRILGLLLAAVAAQFLLNALADLRLVTLPPA